MIDITIDIDKTKIGTKRFRKEDIFQDVAVEDLFSELLRVQIIRNYQSIFLRDWFGDLSYQNYEAHREFRDYKHRLGEVKQLVLEYCILPLISKETHQIAPLVRSVCIYGLPRTGKTSLANVICSEVIFLLSISSHVTIMLKDIEYVSTKYKNFLILCNLSDSELKYNVFLICLFELS